MVFILHYSNYRYPKNQDNSTNNNIEGDNRNDLIYNNEEIKKKRNHIKAFYWGFTTAVDK